jgi:putative oxidoreductase
VDFGLLVLRTTVGLTLTAHDAQKLFGWFCGHGPAGPLSLSRHSDSGN